MIIEQPVVNRFERALRRDIVGKLRIERFRIRNQRRVTDRSRRAVRAGLMIRRRIRIVVAADQDEPEKGGGEKPNRSHGRIRLSGVRHFGWLLRFETQSSVFPIRFRVVIALI